MRDVASTLFQNVHAIQQRVAAIEGKLKFFSPQVAAPKPQIPVVKQVHQTVVSAPEVRPYFPKELALALRQKLDSPQPVSEDYDAMIAEAADRNGIDPDLVKAVVKAESGFRPDAVSPAGAQGLMQLMPSTAASLGVSDPFDPAQNIEAGARYLKTQIDRFGSTELALAAYNAGPGAVARYGGVPPYNETRNYVSRVMGYLSDIQNGK